MWVTDSDDGLQTVIGRAAGGDATWFLAAVNRIADILASEGDEDLVGARRFKAIGILAQRDGPSSCSSTTSTIREIPLTRPNLTRTRASTRTPCLSAEARRVTTTPLNRHWMTYRRNPRPTQPTTTPRSTSRLCTMAGTPPDRG